MRLLKLKNCHDSGVSYLNPGSISQVKRFESYNECYTIVTLNTGEFLTVAEKPEEIIARLEAEVV